MKLDLKLLKKLLVLNHPSQKEWPMISTIINECYKIGNLSFEMDHYANIFITKNTSDPEFFPCVVAHMDCVLAHTNKEVRIKNGKIYGRDQITGKQIGLGADDANGICVAIQLLKEIPNLKVCFTTEEEIGYLGASEAAENIEFFNNVSYLIQADRHGKSDLITYTNCIYSASEEWLEKITPIMVKYNYSEQIGLGTDIGELAEKLELSGVNVSCGYYNEHRDTEHIIISELQNCLNFIEEIIKTVSTDKQYEIKIDYKAYNSTQKSFKDFDYPSDWDSDLPCYNCKSYDCMRCPYDNLMYGSNAKTKIVY